MIWSPAGKKNSPCHFEWLKKKEWQHVTLSSRIRNAGQKAKFGQIADGRLWIRTSENIHCGGLYISRFGMILPAFEPQTVEPKEFSTLQSLIRSRQDKIFSIIGMSNRVEFIENFLTKKAQRVENYHMLTGKTLTQQSSSLTLKRATANDLERLWPLERAYQIEEVLQKDSRINESYAKKLFLDSLKNQIIFYGALNGRAVAKAGTNAQGYTYDQIGGVFVTPEHRNKGYACQVMTTLLNSIYASGKKACLFVKNTNIAALSLYRNLGFQDKGTFRISYWN